jgi:hypothetical protein
MNASCDWRSPPRPVPRKVRPPTSMDRTSVMNAARSRANAVEPAGSWSVATTPGSQVCTDHGSW